MKKKREELLTRMIKLYGFEHEAVIQFAAMMARPQISDKTLEVLVKCHEEYPLWEEEEEEETEECEIDELDLCSYNPYTGEIVADEYEEEEL